MTPRVTVFALPRHERANRRQVNRKDMAIGALHPCALLLPPPHGKEIRAKYPAGSGNNNTLLSVFRRRTKKRFRPDMRYKMCQA